MKKGNNLVTLEKEEEVSLISLNARGLFSTKVIDSAPLLADSKPIIPVPEKRSHTELS